MKYAWLARIAFIGNVVLSGFVLSGAAMAAPSGASDFNHMKTGFPLTGAHTAVACVTCHIDGVFKGTPRACDGCHAIGKRVVATPKSGNHVITDAPCETCHFNTATFLGARFNHATTKPEQCAACHNGRIAQGRPANHNLGKKATDSCDHCHRTSAFIPSSWNHIGVAPGTCTTCHVPGGQSSISKPASHTSVSIKGMNQCDDCHSFNGWFPARFKHNTGAACASCHNGSLATGNPTSHNTFVGWPLACNQCHTSTFSWFGALGAKPQNHIPYNPGASCGNCHIGSANVSVATLHANSVASYTCANCHITPNSYTGNNQKTRNSHDGSSGNNCTSCHEHTNAGSYGSW